MTTASEAYEGLRDPTLCLAAPGATAGCDCCLERKRAPAAAATATRLPEHLIHDPEHGRVAGGSRLEKESSTSRASRQSQPVQSCRCPGRRWAGPVDEPGLLSLLLDGSHEPEENVSGHGRPCRDGASCPETASLSGLLKRPARAPRPVSPFVRSSHQEVSTQLFRIPAEETVNS